MKIRVLFIALFSLLLFLPAQLTGGAVFKKDGSVLQGRVLKESETGVSILVNRRQVDVSSEEILRVLDHDNYMTKYYIYRSGAPAIHVHVTGEDKKHYFIRQELAGPEEKIQKKKVLVMSEDPVPGLEKEVKDRGKRFSNLFGFRYGSAILVSDAGKKMEHVNVTYQPFLGLGTQVLLVDLFYYDDWFDMEWNSMPASSLFYPLNYSRPSGFNDIQNTGMRYMAFSMVGYPFHGLGVDLGIGLEYMMLSINGIEISGENPPVIYVDADMQVASLVLTYRIKDMIRLALNVGWSFNKNITAEDTFFNTKHYKQLTYYPVSEFSFEVFPLGNLSLKASYMFIPLIQRKDASNRLELYHHYIGFSVGYGFNMR